MFSDMVGTLLATTTIGLLTLIGEIWDWYLN